MKKTNSRLIKIAGYLLALCVLPGVGCKDKAKSSAEAGGTFEVMGTTAYVSAHQSRVQAKMVYLDSILSLYQPKSDVAKINSVAGANRMPVLKETMNILEYAVHYNKLTEGAFDITTAPLAQLWGFHGGELPAKPLQEALLAGALQSLGSDNIKLADNFVFLETEYTKIDLGGLAIGYAVDLSLIDLRSSGVDDVLIQLGRSARCLGQPRPLPVPHPNDTEKSVGTIQLRGGQGMAFSISKDRTVTVDNESYSHVIDPRTGRPASGTIMTAVISPTATEADGLSTALMVLGLEEGPRILKNFPESKIMIVPKKEPLELWMTENFKNQFTPDAGFEGAIRILTPDLASTNAPVATDLPE